MSGTRAKAVRRLYRDVVLGVKIFPEGAFWDLMSLVLREMPRRKTRNPERAFKRAYLEARRNGSRFRPLPVGLRSRKPRNRH